MASKRNTPFINIRGMVAFPDTEINLTIGRLKSVTAIEHSMSDHHGYLVLISQKQSENNEPNGIDDMYEIGTLVQINKHVRLDDAMKIHCVGLSRVAVKDVRLDNNIQMVHSEDLPLGEDEAKVSENDRSDILSLLKKWCPRLQNRKNVQVESLEATNDVGLFVKKTLDIITYFDIDKKSPNQNVLAAAKSGLGEAYRQSFDANESAINLLVEMRQAILESDSHGKQITLIKNLLEEEIKLFDAV